jgi:hypothetical protein
MGWWFGRKARRRGDGVGADGVGRDRSGVPRVRRL